MEQNYQGFSIEDIQEALKTDFSINTDARSVIATSPWGLMALQDTPFSQARGEGEFWSDLYASYNRVVDNEYIDQIQQKIKDLRVLVALETSICQLIDSHLMRAKS
jgi:oxidase EvaA